MAGMVIRIPATTAAKANECVRPRWPSNEPYSTPLKNPMASISGRTARAAASQYRPRGRGRGNAIPIVTATITGEAILAVPGVELDLLDREKSSRPFHILSILVPELLRHHFFFARDP